MRSTSLLKIKKNCFVLKTQPHSHARSTNEAEVNIRAF